MKIHKIDLHMHSNVSDGTDTPEEILEKVNTAGIDLFSLTDHDAIMGCVMIKKNLGEDDPLFLSGVEFSCRDEFGKYHILGYGYDSSVGPVRSLVEEGHNARFEKLELRLKALQDVYGISFSDEDKALLYELNNPGKPHIANLLVKYGYVDTKDEAFANYLNQLKIPNLQFRPEKAISAILESGGIPILAHPSLGSGDEMICGENMEIRLKRLMGFGLEGLEAYYSRLTPDLQNELLGLSEKYNLYVTAGSDYHGKNKDILLGSNHLDDVELACSGLRRFLEDVPLR